MPPGPTAGEHDRGSVTAELAMALPTLMVVLAVGLYALAAVSLQGRCADAAYATARAVARGDDTAATRTHVLSVLPPGSTIRIGRTDPGLVTVQVEAPLPTPAGLHFAVNGKVIHASATAAEEAAP
ncbi:MAG TPA: TadE family type IV pilus minor pilin [Frankiaceae bacterium]|nr:TadE family type IV pilus minor pilin [Frankiaceae bacterium]